MNDNDLDAAHETMKAVCVLSPTGSRTSPRPCLMVRCFSGTSETKKRESENWYKQRLGVEDCVVQLSERGIHVVHRLRHPVAKRERLTASNA